LAIQTYIEPPYVTISGFDGVALYELLEDQAPLKFPPIPIPVAPDNPIGPVGPVEPDGPVDPVEPNGPVGPVEPDGPVEPVTPITPVGPVVPISLIGLKWIFCIVSCAKLLLKITDRYKGPDIALAVLFTS
jgi:hypothetical protein